MNVSIVFSVVAAATVCTAFARGAKTTISPDELAENRRKFYQQSGGYVAKPGSASGKVAIVNCDAAVKDGLFGPMMESFNSLFTVQIDIRRGEFSGLGKVGEMIRSAGGAAGVVIARIDPNLPALSYFPDLKAAVVNTAALPENPSESLVRKEVIRGFVLACGGACSQYHPSIVSPFETAKQLEAFHSEGVPVDVCMRVKRMLRNYGVTPYRLTTYRGACQEGWAPAPTNDVQRAIFENVKAEIEQKPSNPIKIKPGQKPAAK